MKLKTQKQFQVKISNKEYKQFTNLADAKNFAKTNNIKQIQKFKIEFIKNINLKKEETWKK